MEESVSCKKTSNCSKSKNYCTNQFNMPWPSLYWQLCDVTMAIQATNRRIVDRVAGSAMPVHDQVSHRLDDAAMQYTSGIIMCYQSLAKAIG